MTDKRYAPLCQLPETKMVRLCVSQYGLHPSDVISMLRNDGMHQRDIAALLGVSLSSVRHWQRPDVGGTIYDDAHRERARKAMRRINAQGLNHRSTWRGQRICPGSR